MTTANEELEDLTPVGELPDMVAFNRGVAFARQQIELDAISKKSLDDIEKKSKEEARSLEIQLDEQNDYLREEVAKKKKTKRNDQDDDLPFEKKSKSSHKATTTAGRKSENYKMTQQLIFAFRSEMTIKDYNKARDTLEGKIKKMGDLQITQLLIEAEKIIQEIPEDKRLLEILENASARTKTTFKDSKKMDNDQLLKTIADNKAKIETLKYQLERYYNDLYIYECVDTSRSTDAIKLVKKLLKLEHISRLNNDDSESNDINTSENGGVDPDDIFVD
jgi:hypothetical protein